MRERDAVHVYQFYWRLSWQVVGRPVKAEHVEMAVRSLVLDLSSLSPDGTTYLQKLGGIRIVGLDEAARPSHLLVDLLTGPQKRRTVAVVDVGSRTAKWLKGLS